MYVSMYVWVNVRLLCTLCRLRAYVCMVRFFKYYVCTMRVMCVCVVRFVCMYVRMYVCMYMRVGNVLRVLNVYYECMYSYFLCIHVRYV